jgi:hypothetical protein
MHRGTLAGFGLVAFETDAGRVHVEKIGVVAAVGVVAGDAAVLIQQGGMDLFLLQTLQDIMALLADLENRSLQLHPGGEPVEHVAFPTVLALEGGMIVLALALLLELGVALEAVLVGGGPELGKGRARDQETG